MVNNDSPKVDCSYRYHATVYCYRVITHLCHKGLFIIYRCHKALFIVYRYHETLALINVYLQVGWVSATRYNRSRLYWRTKHSFSITHHCRTFVKKFSGAFMIPILQWTRWNCLEGVWYIVVYFNALCYIIITIIMRQNVGPHHCNAYQSTRQSSHLAFSLFQIFQSGFFMAYLNYSLESFHWISVLNFDFVSISKWIETFSFSKEATNGSLV